jgi:hypothetical protein
MSMLHGLFDLCRVFAKFKFPKPMSLSWGLTLYNDEPRL